MSLSTFIAEVSDLVVDGVRTRYAAPPERLATANLPAFYPRLPASLAAQAAVLSASMTIMPKLTVELAIVVEPVGQSTAPVNFTRTVALIDALHNALVASMATSETIDAWTVTLTAEQIGADAYWVLVATVNGSEQ